MLRYAVAFLMIATVLFGIEAEIPDAPYPSDYAKGPPDRNLWRDLRDSFLRHRFQSILNKHGMSLSCAKCTSVFMDVSFAVTELGQVRIREMDQKRACGGTFPAAMEKDFLAYLHDYPYPKPLHGSTVRLRLGSGLKC